MPTPKVAANGLDDFTNGLALILKLDDEQAIKLVDLLEDRMKELANDALDREFNRGDYRY